MARGNVGEEFLSIVPSRFGYLRTPLPDDASPVASRHPDRCSVLVLISSNAPGETEAALPPEPLAKVVFKSDFMFWLLTIYFRSSMRSTMGVPEGFELTPEYEADVAEVMKTILPVSPRSATLRAGEADRYAGEAK